MIAFNAKSLRRLAIAAVTALGLAACAASDGAEATAGARPDQDVERERGGM